MRYLKVLLGLTLALSMFAIGCRKAEEPPPPTVRVENTQLGIAIAALSDFAVSSNEGAAIELTPSDEGVTGQVTVVAGEAETGGINLIAAVEQHKADILERADGDYKGSNEYVAPLGTTFASRGRYTSDGAMLEELNVFMVHPWGDRTLQVIYRYPVADDTEARLGALMNGVIGELEGLPPAEVESITQDADETTGS